MKFLLCVGAEKAGTTWLHSYFKLHPNYHDIGKELNVLQRDDMVPTFVHHEGFKENIETYFDHIAATPASKVTGDFTHYEGSTENVFRLLKDGLERRGIEVVPVYIMRDPIRRAWSAWNMIGGGQSVEMPHPAYFYTQSNLSCKYKETVQALDNVFANPLYFFYETFFEQSNMDRICQSLGVDTMHAPMDIKINVGRYDKGAAIPKEFAETFGRSSKNVEAVKFLTERFSDVPWRLEDYA